MYNKCPYKWKLQYKDKLKGFTSTIHTVFGTAIHETIQHYLDVMYSDTVKKADEIDLGGYFKSKFIEEYKMQKEKNENKHFSTAIEMREFNEDGENILKWFKSKRRKYFSRKNTYLVGCEIPLIMNINPDIPNLVYVAYLDVVLYDEKRDKFKIIDIKTSTKGWNKWAKKDEDKQFQILLYKRYFGKLYNIPEDKIDVEFFIVKRKVLDWDDEDLMSPHQTYRVQTFTPPNGKIKLNKAERYAQTFITECFQPDTTIKDRKYIKNVSKFNCTYCPFSKDGTCKEGSIFS